MTLPPVLTPAEVAEVCRVSQATVMRWARDGRLETVHRLG